MAGRVFGPTPPWVGAGARTQQPPPRYPRGRREPNFTTRRAPRPAPTHEHPRRRRLGLHRFRLPEKSDKLKINPTKIKKRDQKRWRARFSTGFRRTRTHRSWSRRTPPRDSSASSQSRRRWWSGPVQPPGLPSPPCRRALLLPLALTHRDRRRAAARAHVLPCPASLPGTDA